MKKMIEIFCILVSTAPAFAGNVAGRMVELHVSKVGAVGTIIKERHATANGYRDLFGIPVTIELINSCNKFSGQLDRVKTAIISEKKVATFQLVAMGINDPTAEHCKETLKTLETHFLVSFHHGINDDQFFKVEISGDAYVIHYNKAKGIMNINRR